MAKTRRPTKAKTAKTAKTAKAKTRPTKAKARPAKAPPARGAKRRARDARRSRWGLVGATVVGAVILAAWFPASALYHQHTALAAANAQLAQLHSQDVALTQERHNLNDAAEVGRIARQQYQLVSPGQRAFAVLPPAGTAPANAPYAGDPGTSAPVAPSAASELPPGTVTTTTSTPAVPTKAAASAAAAAGPDNTAAEGTWARMVHALEFWR